MDQGTVAPFPVVCIQNILNVVGIEINECLYPTGLGRVRWDGVLSIRGWDVI
jgi:hypothetical protein